MISLCADLHGDLGAIYEFDENNRGLTKEDILIVLGDFGVCRKNIEEIKALDSRVAFTVLFIDGNHEDFSLISSFPEREKYGGRVHDICGVYHLIRSEIYKLPSAGSVKTFAALGGADSRDREKREAGVDWFPEEAITDEEVERLLINAERYGMRVDYFLSHAPSSAIKEEWDYEFKKNHKGKSPYEPTPSDYKVRDVIARLDARVYYSAHEHVERVCELAGKQYASVYRRIIKIDK